MTDGARPPVFFERIDPHLAVVTLNRPEKRNAVNGAMTKIMAGIVREIEQDPDIWVCILASSNNDVFCAGADLGEIAQGLHAGHVTADGGFVGFADAKRTKPWIAAVDGAALAGGFELCLACDMIVAGESARFGLPEVKRGLVAAGGGICKVPRAIPIAVAKELITTGDPVDAARAYQLGLVNAVVPKGEARSGAIALAGRIACNGPIAVRESLAVARVAQDYQMEKLRAMSMDAVAAIMKTKDFAEGPRAFLEKRPPRWSGT